VTWQPAPVLFPDAEMVACAGIRALLAATAVTGVYVGNRIPNPRKPRMVIFNRDGGASSGVIDNPVIRCRVWDATDQDAIDLARLVLSLWPRLADGNPVLSAGHESGPYDVPDESGTPQKYLLLSLRTRGEQAPDPG
jgi:hypothetical protein